MRTTLRTEDDVVVTIPNKVSSCVGCHAPTETLPALQRIALRLWYALLKARHAILRTVHFHSLPASICADTGAEEEMTLIWCVLFCACPAHVARLWPT